MAFLFNTDAISELLRPRPAMAYLKQIHEILLKFQPSFGIPLNRSAVAVGMPATRQPPRTPGCAVLRRPPWTETHIRLFLGALRPTFGFPRLRVGLYQFHFASEIRNPPVNMIKEPVRRIP